MGRDVVPIANAPLIHRIRQGDNQRLELGIGGQQLHR